VVKQHANAHERDAEATAPMFQPIHLFVPRSSTDAKIQS
jgi:hypothetical protein